MRQQNRLFAFLLLALLGSVFAATALAAQEHSSSPVPNTIWVGADGKFESDPDTALVQFNISAQDEKLPAATDRATQAAEQVRQLLRGNGIDPKEAQVGRFSVEPVYDYKNPKRKLVGYRVNTDISVKLKDFTKIGPITQGIANMSDVTGNQSLSYELEDMDAAKIKAVEDALHRAHDEAAAVARASGRALSELSYASVDTYERVPVRPMMMAKAGASAMGGPAEAPPPTAEFGAQKITVTAHVNALYTMMK